MNSDTRYVFSIISADHQLLAALLTIRPAALVSQLAGELLRSACNLITACLSPSTVQLDETQRLLDQYLDLAMRRREIECQEAVARTFDRLSELRGCSKEAKKWVYSSLLFCRDSTTLTVLPRLIGDLMAIRAVVRQAAALSLGHIQYAHCSVPVEKSVNALLGQLKPDGKVSDQKRSIEAK